MDSDSALRLLGERSKWQLQRYTVYAVGFGIPFSWMLMSVVFIGDTPAHRCALPANSTMNESIPRIYNNDGTWEWSKCTMYTEPGQYNHTMKCAHGVWYDPMSGYDSTVVSDFDLVCDHHWMFELTLTISAVGSAFGGVVFTRLSDLYGRRKIFIACMWSNAVLAIIMAFSPNYLFYTILSFIDGFQQQGAAAISINLAMELFPTEGRTFAGCAIEFFWAFGYMVLAPIAYFTRNWRHLQLAISVPLLLTFTFYWWVAESIPWLVSNGRYREAEDLMKKAAITNGITIPDNLFTDPALINDNATIKNKETSGSHLKISCQRSDGMKYGVMDILKSKTLRKYAFLLFFIWFVNAVTYFSINLTVTYLPGDRYLNLFLYALMEVPAYAFTWYIIHRVGRRIPLSVFHFIAGISLLLNIVTSFVPGADITALVIIINVIGKFGITSSFAIIIVNTPEIFPTNIRNIGIGLCMTVSRIASYITPYTRTLYRIYPWMPPVIVGILSIVAGFLALMLPETRHTKLPDSIEEVEEWDRCKKKHKG